MYDELMGMDGLGALDTEQLKQDVMQYAVLGVSAAASAAVARLVVGEINSRWTTRPQWAKYAIPVAPIALGIGIGVYARTKSLSVNAQRAADGAALGMAAYGLALLLSEIPKVGQFSPFAAPAAFSDLKGLGAMQDLSVQAYLNGAPMAVERLSGAPMAVERLNGAPTVVETGLNGYSSLASTLM